MRVCSLVNRGSLNRIRAWPPRRNERSVVVFVAGATWRSDWPDHGQAAGAVVAVVVVEA